MNHASIPFKIKLALLFTVVLWASAFVGIRAGLMGYSPGGLALLRFIVASLCMCVIYFFAGRRTFIPWVDKLKLLSIGAIGLGWYNIFLNYGEITVSSGVSSFIISQSPIVTAIFAYLFLGERFTPLRLLGMLISVFGVLLISFGQISGFDFHVDTIYLYLATILSALYTIFQKPLLVKYHSIDVAAYLIWGCTLMLLIFIPHLGHELKTASWHATIAVIYMGIFPAALANVAWAYGLAAVPASRAITFLYFLPIIATIIGWIWLGEVPPLLAFIGGLIALFGVWVVNQSYQRQLKKEMNCNI